MESIEKHLFNEEKGKGFLNIRKPVGVNQEIISYIGVKERKYTQGDTEVILFTPDIDRSHDKQRMNKSINLFEKTIFPYTCITEGNYFCNNDKDLVVRVEDRAEANRIYSEE